MLQHMTRHCSRLSFCQRSLKTHCSLSLNEHYRFIALVVQERPAHEQTSSRWQRWRMHVIFLPTHTHRSLSAKEPYNCITHYTPSIKEPYAHTALWWWQRFRVVSQRKIHTHTPLSFRKRALQIHRQSALGVHRSLSAKDF